jgi:pre-mRNA-splicing factor CWC22
MKAQMLSLVFTPTFAALASVVNTKLPMVGELLVTRLVSQFRRSFKRNDKPVCHATAMFLAHLVNQRVVHEVLALEVLVLLLEKPTDDAVEVAVSFMREVGAFLAEESPKASNSIFDRFRAVLYEGDISKRVQYMIEVLSQVRQQKFKDNPRIPEALDLVEEEDQITHRIGLDDELNVQEGLSGLRECEMRCKALTSTLLQTSSSPTQTSRPTSASTPRSRPRFWARTRTLRRAAAPRARARAARVTMRARGRHSKRPRWRSWKSRTRPRQTWSTCAARST